jgi:hypothetical protein
MHDNWARTSPNLPPDGLSDVECAMRGRFATAQGALRLPSRHRQRALFFGKIGIARRDRRSVSRETRQRVAVPLPIFAMAVGKAERASSAMPGRGPVFPMPVSRRSHAKLAIINSLFVLMHENERPRWPRMQQL